MFVYEYIVGAHAQRAVVPATLPDLEERFVESVHSGTARPTCLQVARAVSPMVAGMIPAAVVMQRRVRHHLATSAAAAAGGAFFEAVDAFLSAGIPRAVIARRAIAA